MRDRFFGFSQLDVQFAEGPVNALIQGGDAVFGADAARRQQMVYGPGIIAFRQVAVRQKKVGVRLSVGIVDGPGFRDDFAGEDQPRIGIVEGIVISLLRLFP